MVLMASLRDWLMFSRIHTAALTISSALLGYFLAGGQLLSWWTLAWGVFGLIFHWAGFVDNNLQDYRYDLSDPSKKHFPLGRSISPTAAVRFTIALYTVGLALATWLSWGNVSAFFIFLTCLGFGLLYNRTNKTSLLAGVWIGLCFAPLPVFVFYLTAGTVSPLMLWVALYGFGQVFFQNAISGSLKDLKTSEWNPLVALGAEVYPGGPSADRSSIVANPDTLIMPARAWGFSLAVKLLAMVPLLLILFSTTGSGGWFVLAFAGATGLFSMAFGFTCDMLAQTWFKNKLLKTLMTVVEILTFYAVVVAVSPVIGWSSLFLIGFSIVYFVVMNRLTWGTILTPDV